MIPATILESARKNGIPSREALILSPVAHWCRWQKNTGGFVRVAPAGRRSVRNTGREALVMLCVQYKGGTFTAEDAADGVILNEPVSW